MKIGCGKDSWTVKKRFSNFVTLRRNVIDELVPIHGTIVCGDIPILPPKTIISIVNDEDAIIQRKELLEKWLQTLLECLSRNNVLTLKCIRNFLGFDEFEETFTD